MHGITGKAPFPHKKSHCHHEKQRQYTASHHLNILKHTSRSFPDTKTWSLIFSFLFIIPPRWLVDKSASGGYT